MKTRLYVRSVVCAVVTVVSSMSALSAAPAADVRKAMKSGWDLLVKSQDSDGAWGIWIPARTKDDAPPAYQANVGISALCLYALAKAPDRAAYQPAIDKAAAFLLSHRKADGTFSDADGMEVNYKTSVALLALAQVDPKKYGKEIQSAKDAIVKSITLDPADRKNYGGAGYLPGEKGRGADLNNTVFAAEAIKRAEELGIAVDPAVYQAMQAYVTRVQNLEMSNDLMREMGKGVQAGDEGGFPYRPGESKANEARTGKSTEPVVLPDGRKAFISYGSMTYAGLLSFVYADVPKGDPRVVAAWEWIRRHYTLAENPGMAAPRNPAKGQEGLYYYYHTFAKACAKYGIDAIETPDGVKHAWADELSTKLLAIQQPDGSWINEKDRWFEGSVPLVTSYILLSLDYCVQGMGK